LVSSNPNRSEIIEKKKSESLSGIVRSNTLHTDKQSKKNSEDKTSATVIDGGRKTLKGSDLKIKEIELDY